MAAPLVVPQRPAPQVQPPSSPELSHLLTVVVGVVVVAALYFARDVLIPITLAVLLSFVVSPIVRLFRKIGLWKVPSVLLSVVIALGVIVSLGSVIGVQVAGLAQNAAQYQRTIQQKMDSVSGYTTGRVNEILGSFERKPQAARPAAPEANAGGGLRNAAPEGERVVPVEIRPGTASPLELAKEVLTPILAPLETALIVVIVAVFILLQQDDLRDRLIRLFGSDDLHRTTTAMDEAARRLGKYFLAQLAINAAFGLAITVGLYVVGVPSPFLWGILAGLLRFVPYIGALLAAVFPMALAAAVDPGWSMLLWTLAIFAIAEPLMGQVIEPMVYGHSTGLSPLSVVVAAIFWTWLWGPIGLILSTPMTLCLVVLGRYFERLEFLDVLLGDRPALTPAENFYQRMLAGDADEAQAQAESLMQDRSLTSYYDSVALRGLQLAANDAQRGVLMADQITLIKESAQIVVAELGQYQPPEPSSTEADPAQEKTVAEKSLPIEGKPNLPLPPMPPGTPSFSVLCIAGRGKLDDAAAAMLAQLLIKHGMQARTLPHEVSERGRIEALDNSDVSMVCVSYVEVTGNPAHLRYLIRRLRARMPGVPMLVGLWPAGEAALTDAHIRQTIGADHYASSLHEAVGACLLTARTALGVPEGS